VTCDGKQACDHASVKCASGPCSMTCQGDGDACHDAQLGCGTNACAATCDGAKGPDVNCGEACSCSRCD
jgi:hypothetical protein